MKINFVVPQIDKKQFTGGIYCLLQYADGLAKLGHDVNVIPLFPSPEPKWFADSFSFKYIGGINDSIRFRASSIFILRLLFLLIRDRGHLQPNFKLEIREFSRKFINKLAQYSTYGIRRGLSIDHMARYLPPADVTVATDSETVYPVALVNPGVCCYFSQHYEPLFWREREGGLLGKRNAELSYNFGFHQIANSRWLYEKLIKLGLHNEISVCPNAIDHSIFFGTPRKRDNITILNIISYGGRDAEWKGFKDMCEGFRLAQDACPNIIFNWFVYGKALLPPDNQIFPYVSLGFLLPTELSAAYRKCDVLLSASWYESFPLFPIEAMACGLAVICGKLGTEEYATNDLTALIVEPKNPLSISFALKRLADDENFRYNLAIRGCEQSKKFTWNKSVEKMEEILITQVTK